MKSYTTREFFWGEGAPVSPPLPPQKGGAHVVGSTTHAGGRSHTPPVFSFRGGGCSCCVPNSPATKWGDTGGQHCPARVAEITPHPCLFAGGGSCCVPSSDLLFLLAPMVAEQLPPRFHLLFPEIFFLKNGGVGCEHQCRCFPPKNKNGNELRRLLGECERAGGGFDAHLGGGGPGGDGDTQL